MYFVGGENNGNAGASGSSNNGTNVALESINEWQIQEITFDGQERYIMPKVFSDHVARLAHKVNWRQLVSSSCVHDQDEAVFTADVPISDHMDSDEPVEAKKSRTEPPHHASQKGPESGMWHGVAKHLHHSLQQMSVLLDTFSVARHQQYLAPRSISLDEQSQGIMQSEADRAAEQVALQEHRQALWIVKRKALSEASKLLDEAVKKRRERAEIQDAQKESFLQALQSLRKHWRVKRVAGKVVGDLGYRTYGAKFLANETFEIERHTDTGQALTVSLPKDLSRRAFISVSVEKDDTGKLFDEEQEGEDEDDRVTDNGVKSVHWSKALLWAQETLLCRDLFSLLCKQAIEMEDRFSVVKRGVLAVALHNHYFMKIKLTYRPFTDEDVNVREGEGNDYLTSCLRRMFVKDESSRCIQLDSGQFSSMPLTGTGQQLNMSAPRSLSADTIERLSASEIPLLKRQTDLVCHYILIKKMAAVLNEICGGLNDPQVSWRWVFCSSLNSCARVIITTRNFDGTRLVFDVRVNCEKIVLIHMIHRDPQQIECSRDEKQLLKAVQFMIGQYQLNCLLTICRQIGWSPLHANANASDDQGDTAPSFYATNASGTRRVFVQLFLNKDPLIRVRKTDNKTSNGYTDTEKFDHIDYRKLIGPSFCRKIENFLLMMQR